MTDLEFHHIGVACRNLELECRHWQPVGYRAEGSVFEDQAQGIRGQFLVGGGPRLEVLEPLDGDETLTRWLKAGSTMYHHAYVTDDLRGSLEGLTRDGARLVREPVASVAFGGRQICFLSLRNLLLVELINRTAPLR